MMVLQLTWVKLIAPETKGVSLEDMQHTLGIDVEPEPNTATASKAAKR